MKKPPELDEELWEENRKIMDIVDEKTFQPGQRQGRKNRRWCGERRNLIRNKVLFSSQRGQTANGSIHQMQAPRRSLRQRVRSLATCRLLAPLKTKLTRIPSLSSYPHLTHFVVRPFAGRSRFCLRSSIGIAVGLAIKWPAALSFGTVGPSRWRSNHQGSEPSGVKLSRVNLCWWSRRRCNVNKRQSRFGGRKNDRLMINKKPPNPVEIEEENQSRTDLVVVQSFRIKLPSRLVVRRVITLIAIHLCDLGRR